MQNVEELIKIIKQENLDKVDIEIIRLAYDFADEAHHGQMRANGDPYVVHSLETAKTLAKLHLDQDTIVAGLLHDVPEDTVFTLKDIEKNFGNSVARLVEGITKLGKLKYRGIERYLENLRRMFVAVASDIRVIFIKFADRLHNLKTLNAIPREKQERVARETLEIYAPIANRLGIWELKDQLEDLSFKYLYPQEYVDMEKRLEKKYSQRKNILKKVQNEIKKAITKEKINVTSITGRTKGLWKLYQKMLKHDNNFDKIHDIVALRIIVDNIENCYKALGIIHSIWTPLPSRIKDYIAQPKPNGYQSLHTTVFYDRGETVEIQIKTQEMHLSAEYGIAAHWHYDEKGSIKPDQKQFRWIEELAHWQEENKDNQSYLESLKIDAFQDRIFVFTPKGDVIDLPENSTPIDFAYHIHTDIGNTTTAARVNEQIASLDTPLRSGDMVEIITDKNRKNPNRDWLKFVKTSMAKDKIKSTAPKTIWSSILNFTDRRKK